MRIIDVMTAVIIPNVRLGNKGLVLEKPGDKTTKKDVMYIKELFEKYGSIEYAKKISREYIKRAKQAISKDTPSELKHFLHEFADFIVRG